jgi:hypothetical protein
MALVQFEKELFLNELDTDPADYPVQDWISGRIFDMTRYRIFSQTRYWISNSISGRMLDSLFYKGYPAGYSMSSGIPDILPNIW